MWPRTFGALNERACKNQRGTLLRNSAHAKPFGTCERIRPANGSLPMPITDRAIQLLRVTGKCYSLKCRRWKMYKTQ